MKKLASLSRNNVTYDSDDGGMDVGMDNGTYENKYTVRKTWERYTINELVDLYVASLAKGKLGLESTGTQQKWHIYGRKLQLSPSWTKALPNI